MMFSISKQEENFLQESAAAMFQVPVLQCLRQSFAFLCPTSPPLLPLETGGKRRMSAPLPM